ncbi:MAG: aminotransferase class I/II-fold pyridoxal phosphate-dependent enzyme [Gammaproteobacteria bacterium]|nr:aminotransferase class I/II-fold pyridoxal phosphate-dependent enzyme [Gammaproteobacteria bacterium]
MEFAYRMPADWLNQITPFRVMELMKRAEELEARGHKVVHFEVGEPDFNTAEPIIEAGRQALIDGRTKYTHALGLLELREAIARDYATRLGAIVPVERIAVTAGASGGLLLLSALLLDSGDGLLITDPGYPCNEVFVRLTGGVPQRVPVRAADGYELGVDALNAYWQPNTRGLLLASPANPTGAVVGADAVRRLGDAVAARDGFFIMDEIYQGLTYGDERAITTGLAVTDGLIVLNSFSKYYGMTGWRLGWLVLPEGLVDDLEKLAQNLFISPSSIAQYAAIAAFTPDAMAVHEARRRRFDQRRHQLLTGLEALGLRVPAKPGGAFYLYVDVSQTGIDSLDFCWRLIDEFQVAVTPGIDFGELEADRFVRFAYTTDEESIDVGLNRIGHALEVWGA